MGALGEARGGLSQVALQQQLAAEASADDVASKLAEIAKHVFSVYRLKCGRWTAELGLTPADVP